MLLSRGSMAMALTAIASPRQIRVRFIIANLSPTSRRPLPSFIANRGNLHAETAPVRINSAIRRASTGRASLCQRFLDDLAVVVDGHRAIARADKAPQRIDADE